MMANFDASLVALIIYLFKRIQKTWGGYVFIKI